MGTEFRIQSSQLLNEITGIEYAFQEINVSAPHTLVFCKQNHSSEVCFVEKNANSETITKTLADALITNTDLAIGVQTADCLPVLIATKSASFVAAVHAGWRGLLGGILVKTVSSLKQNGVLISDIVITIGPSIQHCCFEVGSEVIEEFSKTWHRIWQNKSPPWTNTQLKNPLAIKHQAPQTKDSYWFNLQKIAQMQLTDEGLTASQIEVLPVCTYCGTNDHASYRRATHEKQTAGRQWSWIKKRRRPSEMRSEGF